MNRPTYLVTGATGKTGYAVAEQLLSHGAQVRALAHRVDARSERLRAAGAEVVTVDLFDPAGMRAAMDGVQRMYYVPPWHPNMTCRSGWPIRCIHQWLPAKTGWPSGFSRCCPIPLTSR